MKDLPIYLEPHAVKRAAEGRFRFVRLLTDAARLLGYRTRILAHHPVADLAMDPDDEAPALYWRMRPATKGGLVFREAWRAPFWRIERTYERWAWEISELTFDEGAVDPVEASRFCSRLRDDHGIRRGLGDETLIALQADLLRHRSFQACSPIEMVRTVLDRTDGKVRAITHPKGALSQGEHAALNQLARDPRLTIEAGPIEPLLEHGSALVTMNSTSAIAGMLAGLPVTLHAKADFHHIAGPLGTRTTLARSEAYVSWFLTTKIIRAGQPNVVDQIRRRLIALGL